MYAVISSKYTKINIRKMPFDDAVSGAKVVRRDNQIAIITPVKNASIPNSGNESPSFSFVSIAVAIAPGNGRKSRAGTLNMRNIQR